MNLLAGHGHLHVLKVPSVFIQYCVKVMISNFNQILRKSAIFQEEGIFGELWLASIVSELAKLMCERCAKFCLWERGLEQKICSPFLLNYTRVTKCKNEG